MGNIFTFNYLLNKRDYFRVFNQLSDTPSDYEIKALFSSDIYNGDLISNPDISNKLKNNKNYFKFLLKYIKKPAKLETWFIYYFDRLIENFPSELLPKYIEVFLSMEDITKKDNALFKIGNNNEAFLKYCLDNNLFQLLKYSSNVIFPKLDEKKIESLFDYVVETGNIEFNIDDLLKNNPDFIFLCIERNKFNLIKNTNVYDNNSNVEIEKIKSIIELNKKNDEILKFISTIYAKNTDVFELFLSDDDLYQYTGNFILPENYNIPSNLYERINNYFVNTNKSYDYRNIFKHFPNFVEYFYQEKNYNALLNSANNLDESSKKFLLNHFPDLPDNLQYRLISFYNDEIFVFLIKNKFYEETKKVFSINDYSLLTDDLLPCLLELDGNLRNIMSSKLSYSPYFIDFCLENNLYNLLSDIKYGDIKYELRHDSQFYYDHFMYIENLYQKKYLLELLFKKPVLLYDFLISNDTVVLEFMNRFYLDSDKLSTLIKSMEEKEISKSNIETIVNKFCLNQDCFDTLLENELYNCARKKLPDEYVHYIAQKKQYNLLDEININILYKEVVDSNDVELFSYIYKVPIEELNSYISNFNLNILDLLQYAINSNEYPTWKEDFKKILNSKKEEFVSVYNYFENYNVGKDTKKDNIKKLLNLICNFNRYENLLVYLAKNNVQLEDKDLDFINYLFKNDKFFKIDSINGKYNLNDIIENRKKEYSEETNKLFESNNIDEIKDYIFNTLFGTNDISSLLANSSIEKLKILKLNNKNHLELLKKIDQLMYFVQVITSINNCNNIDNLKNILRICDFEKSTKMFNIFTKFNELERSVYELDSKYSLVNLEDAIKNNPELAVVNWKGIEGLKYIDLSNSNYVLYSHMLSDAETVEEICTGDTLEGKHNFICLGPIGHRNEVFYSYDDSKIIFLYDNIVDGSFVCSSVYNMSSNNRINSSSMDVKEFKRDQRGILEESGAIYQQNAEALFFREGLIPKGICLPGHREPTDQEIEIALKYNLVFVRTQEPKKTIDNPKMLKTSHAEKEILGNEDNNKYDEILDIVNTESQTPRKIGIIADPHGMYEPTLAALESMKANGITEIYSLGDNVGNGPNPSEVVELLREYGVKSLFGNHEIYALLAREGKKIIDYLPNHRASHGHKSQVVADWTAQQLTDEQVEYIKNNYSNKIELTSTAGDKVTLIHSDNENVYLDDEKYGFPEIDPDSFIIKGHDHFGNSKTHTVRAVGMGGQNNDENHNALYIVIEENELGHFEIKSITVPFDYQNLHHGVNEANLPDRQDIDKYLGINR